MKDVQQVVNGIQSLFLRFGQQTYEEKCTQLEHAEQSATLALEYGMDEEFALAAFLHDIGHFLAQERQLDGMTEFGYADHATLGAKYLQECGFSARIVAIVGEHVQAKRYLAATQADYVAQLSRPSVETLRQQGGPMSSEELARYQQMPVLEEILLLRKFDDSGKQPESPCRRLPYWLALSRQCLSDA